MSSAPGIGQEAAHAIAEFCAEHFEDSGARRFGLELDALIAVFQSVVARWNPEAAGTEAKEFLTTLHWAELVLTRGCAAGSETAWEEFLGRYRAPLYAAAYRIASDESTARELADSLYAELYGLSDSGTVRASKLHYYSGRGSLEGWLRTVLAQAYVDRHRKTRRETSLDEQLEHGQQFCAREPELVAPADDRIDEATVAEIAGLEAEERFLLGAYYLDGRTLDEIGRVMRVHESTISRKLERVTGSLRKRIRKRLIESGLSAREADEALQDVDVRDLNVSPGKTLRQESKGTTFYKGSEP